MQRRRLLTGLGALVGGGSLAVSTGAFSSVSAERSVSVGLADDAYAFLRMSPISDDGLGGETGRSSTNGEVVEFEIPGDDEGENADAQGVGVDSVYEFHDLLEISNHGTQTVEVYSTYGGGALNDLALVGHNGVLRDEPPILNVGDSISVGLYIDTHGSSIGEFDETLTIIADQPDD
ncbi:MULTISPECIES: hypothetical protein [Halolamina]|uniref:DUF1102 domain-containing protein n=1 Tax=Halolamina pelagica TaxID=699431 RepID=A0A1I5PWN0_9EURY|nr:MULTISPECIES: hypothetical protein [Halolamina]NHX34985.1 hypothetical protein [Halolamina sp. R1-12]SFP38435.1 hypothetical protein SAMN05216277_103141 [Halolamina pelagica]